MLIDPNMGKDVYVGVDPSISNTGLVCIDERGRFVMCMNGKGAYEKGYKRPQFDTLHYQKQANAIAHSLDDYNVAAIGYEGYSLRSVHLVTNLAEYGGILKDRLYTATNVAPIIVAPTRCKRFATGNGRAEKQDIMSQALKECQELAEVDRRILTSDVCDAFFLAKFAMYAANPEAAAEADADNPLRELRTQILKEALNG